MGGSTYILHVEHFKKEEESMKSSIINAESFLLLAK